MTSQTTSAVSEDIKLPRTPNLNQNKGFWKTQHHNWQKYRSIMWFILPAAFFTVFFSYIPMLGVLFSFKDKIVLGGNNGGNVIWNLVNQGWTFQNYIDIFYDPSFFLAVGNTLLINLLKLAICFPLSILVAIQLAEMKSQKLAKTILIIVCIPNFLSWAIVIGVWQNFLDPDTGVLGELIGHQIMADNSLFKILVVLLSAWKETGWGCIIFYAAVTAIDKSYYEAATIDGANRLQKAWYLTIPAIIPTIALSLVLRISGMLAAGFEQIYTMMGINGDLFDTQMTLDTYLYDISVVNRTNIPFATALGVFNGLTGLILMIVGNKITTKTLHRSLW